MLRYYGFLSENVAVTMFVSQSSTLDWSVLMSLYVFFFPV